MATCESCRYYLAGPAPKGAVSTAGLCKRYPPTPLLVAGQGPITPQNPSGLVQEIRGYRPPVAAVDGCGEHGVRLAAA